jgi:hypothetical protein
MDRPRDVIARLAIEGGHRAFQARQLDVQAIDRALSDLVLVATRGDLGVDGGGAPAQTRQ